MLLLSKEAASQAAPNAGSILQQVQPVTPPPPSPSGPGLTIEPQGGGELPSSAPFLVKTLRMTGNTLFDTSTLHALVADEEGKELTLPQLGKVAGRITDYYQRHGYPLTRAVIPAQVIKEGVVDILVVEARFGTVHLENHSRVSDRLLQATLAPLQSGKAITQADLDRPLLLLSDVPGVLVDTILKPGETVATSDLVAKVTPGPAISGNATLDNYGNRFTGRDRFGGAMNLVDPLHYGDVLSVNVLTSGSGMNYGRLAYELLVNGEGTRLGGSYSDLHYRLGAPLTALEAHGTAEVASLWAKHPLVRSASANLYGQLQYDQSRLHDHIDATELRTDRHLDIGTASLTGDVRDTFVTGAVTSASLRWTMGHLGFNDAAAQAADAATAHTQGDFSKWNLNLARLQNLGPKNTLYLAFSAQGASTNLDPSQKMILGGVNSVRAYDVGAVSGDVGILGTIELRHDMGSWQGQWQVVAFVDSAHVSVNRSPWAAGVNSATLSGSGLGLNWSGPHQLGARVYVAKPFGPTPALVPNTDSSRVWAEISWTF
jgi:hemolysin activation/secretion protein